MKKQSYAAQVAASEIARSREFAKTPAGQEKIAYITREAARIRANQSESQSEVQKIVQKQ